MHKFFLFLCLAFNHLFTFSTELSTKNIEMSKLKSKSIDHKPQQSIVFLTYEILENMEASLDNVYDQGENQIFYNNGLPRHYLRKPEYQLNSKHVEYTYQYIRNVLKLCHELSYDSYLEFLDGFLYVVRDIKNYFRKHVLPPDLYKIYVELYVSSHLVNESNCAGHKGYIRPVPFCDPKRHECFYIAGWGYINDFYA